jgi:hypothetical protein
MRARTAKPSYRGLALLLLAGSLPGCATPRDRPVAEDKQVWRCSLSRPVHHGRIHASLTLSRNGAPREAVAFFWERRWTPRGSIHVAWQGTDGIEPPASARAFLYFPVGARYKGHRRLELRRAGPDGRPAETVYSSPFGPNPWRVRARWGDVLEAARDGAFHAISADRHGRIHAQTTIDGAVKFEPGRAAAAIAADMDIMLADHPRSCRLGPDGEGRILVT